jgi:putative membrane-bound dehydrogenase-like protein
MNRIRCLWLPLLVLGIAGTVHGQIPTSHDAPEPLSPDESAGRFKLPAGYRIELVASEPLIREPSGVCWDERGQLYVCELHGYNLEGQYDIEELNKSGQLDRVVRRIQADERHKVAAETGTYGTIERLHDDDSDGRMDRAEVWADRLPPCLGICPARGGIIAACQTEILFLADRDGDGRAEIREVLFEGFAKGPLERSINCPQWGPDHWIYVGRGSGSGAIRGKYLNAPVELPHTDFRIKPDGSAIEPVSGGTHTMGFAFTESGDRFVVSTRDPGIFVAPLPWRYLTRNPDVAAPALEVPAMSDHRVYPVSQPHPWRTRRAADPGFSKYYSDRYGIEESASNGYFTSACSPLVYQDVALPGLRGQLLACEPAQNLVHRAVVDRDGARLTLRRAPGEEQAEFLTSSDPWFHAIALAHAPDGSIFIVDFYREIIEDYSAIPRYLQQQYGLVNGKNHGRIWRLTHAESPRAPAADMSRLSAEQLAADVGSPHFWRRHTARRLLVDRHLKEAGPLLARLAREPDEPVGVLSALHTLDGLNTLQPKDVEWALGHSDASVRRQALRFAERWLDSDPRLVDRVLALAADTAPMVRLQLALSLGEFSDARAMSALVRLGRSHGDEPWIAPAILTAVPGRGDVLLTELLRSPTELRKAEGLLEPLCAALAGRRHAPELSQALIEVAALENRLLQVSCLRGMRSGFQGPADVELSETARAAVKTLALSSDAAVRNEALPMVRLLGMETSAERRDRLAQAASKLGDVRLSVEARLAAVAQLADDNDPEVSRTLLAALPASTPQVRDAILGAFLGRRDRLPALLDGLEAKEVPGSFLSAVQRATLLDAAEPGIRQRAVALLKPVAEVNEELFGSYLKALQGERDGARGENVFREKCADCHQAHGLGHGVGPDLNAEFQRAEETIIRDVLVPSDTITPGYAAYAVATSDGLVFSGLIVAESPTSITLRQSEGKEQIILRKDVDEVRALLVSIMPDDLSNTVAPRDLADLLAWLRRPPAEEVQVRAQTKPDGRDLAQVGVPQDLLAPQTATTVAARVALLEGPAVDVEGNLYFSDIFNNRIYTMTPEGRISVFRNDSGRTNGNTFDLQGRLVSCEGAEQGPGGRRRIVRTDLKTGAVEVLTERYDGKRYNSPNDVCVDAKGRIWFTDPFYGEDRSKLEMETEAIYRIDPDGTVNRVLAQPQIERPNGLAITPDARTLYVVDSHSRPGGNRKIWAFDVSNQGALANQRLVFDFGKGRGGDGVRLDVKGRLWVAAGIAFPRHSGETTDVPPGVYVLTPSGELLGRIPIPEDLTTNLAFGGPDRKTLYVTSGKSIYRIPLTVSGYVLHPPAGR